MNYIRSLTEKERAKKHKEEMQRIAKKNKEQEKKNYETFLIKKIISMVIK